MIGCKRKQQRGNPLYNIEQEYRWLIAPPSYGVLSTHSEIPYANGVDQLRTDHAFPSAPNTAPPMGGCYWTRLVRMGIRGEYHGSVWSVWSCMDLSVCIRCIVRRMYLRGLLYDRCIGQWWISLTTAKTRAKACLCPTTWLTYATWR